MWKTAFKKFEVIWSADADHITLNFLMAIFHILLGPFFEYFAPYGLPHYLYLPNYIL